MPAPLLQLYKKTSSELLPDLRDLLNSRDADACQSDEQLAEALDVSVFDVMACREVLLVEDEMLA
jgi:hypothetical protein